MERRAAARRRAVALVRRQDRAARRSDQGSSACGASWGSGDTQCARPRRCRTRRRPGRRGRRWRRRWRRSARRRFDRGAAHALAHGAQHRQAQRPQWVGAAGQHDARGLFGRAHVRAAHDTHAKLAACDTDLAHTAAPVAAAHGHALAPQGLHAIEQVAILPATRSARRCLRSAPHAGSCRCLLVVPGCLFRQLTGALVALSVSASDVLGSAQLQLAFGREQAQAGALLQPAPKALAEGQRYHHGQQPQAELVPSAVVGEEFC